MDQDKQYANETVGASLTKAANPSELDRMYSLLATQTDMLNTLEIRLHRVSSRAPQEDGRDQADQSDHIATANYVITRNNNTISRLISELVV